MDEHTPDDRFRYVPALDGLRAIAIVLVALFHYPWEHQYFGANPYQGGFLGVDVFFVLSGFLITSLLFQELGETHRISLVAFYARRALRLLPAFAVLFGIAVVSHYAFVDRGKQPSIFGLFSMLGYFANWAQLWRNDPLGPLFGHTWSLAIEEQFYILFPLMLVGALRLGLRRFGVGVVLVVGAIGSAMWRAHLWHASTAPPSFVDWYVNITGRNIPGVNPFGVWNRWYFGTDSRLDGLLLGCAAAVALPWILRHCTRVVRSALLVSAVCAIVGVGFIVGEATILADWIPRWGLLTLNALVVVAVVGIVTNPRSLLTRLFGWRPLVWIGRRSYAIYLFHLLVFNELGHVQDHLSSFWWFWLNVAVIGIVAALSWRFVEQPFLRRKARFERRATPSQEPVGAG